MEVLAQIQLSTLLFLFGLALVVGVLLLRVRRQANPAPDLPERAPVKKKKPGYAAPPPVAPDPRQERSIEHWEVRIHELARDLLAQIETKAGVLQQFVRQADEQAARLETLLRQAAAAGVVERPGPGAEPGPAGPADDAGAEPDGPEPYEEAADSPEPLDGDPPPESTPAIWAAQLPVPDEDSLTASPAEEVSGSLVPRMDPSADLGRPHAPLAAAPRDTDEIYRLADYGLSAEEIAHRVRRPIGEIRLILALRERRVTR